MSLKNVNLFYLFLKVIFTSASVQNLCVWFLFYFWLLPHFNPFFYCFLLYFITNGKDEVFVRKGGLVMLVTVYKLIVSTDDTVYTVWHYISCTQQTSHTNSVKKTRNDRATTHLCVSSCGALNRTSRESPCGGKNIKKCLTGKWFSSWRYIFEFLKSFWHLEDPKEPGTSQQSEGH